MKSLRISSKKILTIILILGLFTTGFGYFGIGSGGIPGLILTTDMLTNFSEFTASYLNPGLLTGVDQKEVTFGVNTWGSGSVRIWSPKYFSFAIPFGLDHTVGLTVTQVGLSNIEKTNYRGDALEGQYLSVAEYAFQGSYAYRLLPYFSVGTNATIIVPDVAEQGELGITFDVGMRFHPIEDYLLGKVSLGMNIQNVYYKDFGGNDENAFNKYPLNIHLQTHWYNEYYRMFFERLEFSFNCAIMDLITEAQNFGDPKSVNTIPSDSLAEIGSKLKDVSVVFGLHGKWFPFKFLGIRAGINTNGVVPFGLSLNWKHINVLKKVRLDYDFGYSTEEELPSSSKFAHIFRLAFRFGNTREEALAEKIYRRLVKEPQNDFNEAMRLYLAKKYWLASFAFGKVLAKWPSFSKVDIATFYMGKSYEYLHMYDVARGVYTRGLKKYTTSDFRPKFIFQIQNLDYKVRDYESALKNYGFIKNLYRDSDVSPDADYIAGQIYYNKRDFQSAMNVLGIIQPGNENYLYAQYTLAIIGVHRKNYEEAKEYLQNIVAADTFRTISEKSLKELAHVKLGQLNFEQGNLKEAYINFSQVSPSSRFYDEALLGLAWTHVRGGKDQAYYNAVKVSDNLISARPNSYLVADAYLLKGYALTLLKKYQDAVDMYKKVIELCDAKYISRNEYKKEVDQYRTTMKRYEMFQKKALNIALRKPSPALLEQKKQMTPKWENYDNRIRDFAQFKQNAKEQFAFKRSAVKLKKDAEYALATTLHLMESQKKQKVIDRTQQKSKKIDKEMQELQKQLEQLEEQEN